MIFIHSLRRSQTDILWYYESQRLRRVLRLSGTSTTSKGLVVGVISAMVENEFKNPLFRPLGRMHTPPEHRRNYMNLKWTNSCLLKTSFSRHSSPSSGSLHTATNPFSSRSSIWTSESQSQSSFSPNSFSTMATTSLYLLWWSPRESENPTRSLRFIISENIPFSSAAVAMNE